MTGWYVLNCAILNLTNNYVNFTKYAKLIYDLVILLHKTSLFKFVQELADNCYVLFVVFRYFWIFLGICKIIIFIITKLQAGTYGEMLINYVHSID